MNIDLSRVGRGIAGRGERRVQPTHCDGELKKCIMFIFDSAAMTRHKLSPIVCAQVKVTFFLELVGVRDSLT